jgi:general secretion pathway protein D
MGHETQVMKKTEYTMASKLRLACRTGRCTLFAVLILWGCAGLAAEVPQVDVTMSPQAGAENLNPDRYRVFLLKFISTQEGIRFLADINITTVSLLNPDSNGTNVLLVTAQQEALIKAASLLAVVDSREKYAVKVLMLASEANRMPAANAIAAEIGNAGAPVSIGTFFSPPGGTSHKAIIDVIGDELVAIAPVSVMDKVIAIAERVKPRPAPAEEADKETALLRAVEPNQPEPSLSRQVYAANKSAEPEPDKLFNELLGSLAEAEKNLAEPNRSPAAVPLSSVEDRKGDAGAELAETAEGKKSITSAFSAVSAVKAAEPNLAEPAQTEPNVTRGEKRETGDAKVRRPYEPEPVSNADETLELTLPEELKIIDLLDMVGKYLNLNYVYDKSKLQNIVVNLKVQGPIKVRELYPLVESVLKFTGLAMTRKGNLVTIVLVADAMDIDPALIGAEGGQVRTGDVVVTRIFQLSFIDTASAKTLIESMKVGAVTELPAAGTIIVTGYAYRMSRVEELLAIIDKPGRPKQFKYRQLRYTMAKTLAPKVKGLVEQMGDISLAIAKPETPAQPGRPTRPASPRQPAQQQPVSTPESAKTAIYLDADERTNRILMIGHETELAVVDDLIDALDVAQQDLRALRMYEIQHVDAKEVKGKLEELGIIGASRSTTTTTGRITGARAAAPGAQAQPGGAPSPTPASSTSGGTELSTEELQVVVIESTNSLLVNASPEQHVLIATIIAYVDSETLQQAIPYVVYPLENQKPTDLAEVLNKLIQETIKDDKGKIQQVIKRQEDEIVIVPDENTFSLIVFASKKNQEWISNLVKSLDKRRPQVLIDVTLVEVSKSDGFEYELNLLSSIPDLTNTSGLTSAILGTDTNGTNKVSALSGKRRFIDFQANRGSGVGFYGDKGINALLTALQTKSYGRVLAKPKILVNDNEAGKIVAQDTTYVEKTSSVVTSATAAQSNLIQTSTDYTGYNAGITLNIKPHISEGELLRLEIGLTRSDFGTITGTKPPDTTSSDIATVVTVPDGSTIILGGLVKLNQSKGGSKVPLLGDLPLIGAAFRTVSDKDLERKLYIFVKAEIIRPGSQAMAKGDMERISDRNRNAFERDERAFQDYNDLPGTKPQPMDPIRVLDIE